jgi:hypothetical protein
MAEPTDQVRNVLEKIRDDAQKALTLLGGSGDQRALSWKCVACGHVKHFTRPVPAEVVNARTAAFCTGGRARVGVALKAFLLGSRN